MILLNSLPDDFNFVKHALQYTGIVLTLDLAISVIKARELELNTSKKSANNLFVKGKSDKKNNTGNSNQSVGFGFKGKTKKGKQKPKWKCYHCGKEGHIKKYCYDLLKKQKQGSDASRAASSYNNLVEVITVSSSIVDNE